MIHVLVAGFRGAMGQKTVKMVQSQKDFALSAVFDPKAIAADAQKYGLPADKKCSRAMISSIPTLPMCGLILPTPLPSLPTLKPRSKPAFTRSLAQAA